MDIKLLQSLDKEAEMANVKDELPYSMWLYILFSIIGAFILLFTNRLEIVVKPLEVTLDQPIPINLHIDSTKKIPYLFLNPATTFIKRGTHLTPEQFVNYQEVEKSRITKKTAILIGYFAFYFVLLQVFFSFIRRRGRKESIRFKRLLALFLLIILLPLICKVFFLFLPISPFAVPILFFTYILVFYYHKEIATVYCVVISLIISSFISFSLLFFLTFVLQTFLIAIWLKHKPIQIFKVFLVSILVGICGFFLFQFGYLIAWGTFYFSLKELLPLDKSVLIIPIQALFWSMVFIIFSPLLNYLFQDISRRTIFNFLDLNHPLLQQLNAKAPGTYAHSMEIANLAEKVANAINSNGLLARVGSYYHDIGKIFQPEYFIENQRDIENPHNLLSPDESVKVIISHVSEGERLAKKFDLPQPIRKFIGQHHGDSVLEYFYTKNLKLGNPKGLNYNHFRYIGDKPQCKETAILMIVDSVEATSRTINSNDPEEVRKVVQEIIFGRILLSQLDESSLTLTELKKIAIILIDSIINAHHERIQYPWQQQKTSEPLKENQ